MFDEHPFGKKSRSGRESCREKKFLVFGEVGTHRTRKPPLRDGFAGRGATAGTRCLWVQPDISAGGKNARGRGWECVSDQISLRHEKMVSAGGGEDGKKNSPEGAPGREANPRGPGSVSTSETAGARNNTSSLTKAGDNGVSVKGITRGSVANSLGSRHGKRKQLHGCRVSAENYPCQ